MGDWADDAAAALLKKPWDVEAAEIAAALRKARADALEEAARVIEDDCHDDITRTEEAAAIRALKDNVVSGSKWWDDPDTYGPSG